MPPTENTPPRDAPGGADGTRPVRPRVAVVSLGCPKNQVDSELMLGRLQADGATIVEDPDAADTMLINTCAFIDKAREESVDTLLEAIEWRNRRPGRRVIAAGCLVQRYGDELAREMPEMDEWVGLDQISQVGRAAPVSQLPAAPAAPRPATWNFDHEHPRHRLSRPWTAYVKIAEGCNQTCSFCAIPTFRGRMRSRTIEDLCAELTALSRQRVREANLIAQDSTGFGRDIGVRDGLAALVRAIEELDESPEWVRLHYLYPGRISSGLVGALRDSHRMVEYVDLPLQHADSQILRAMRRPGDAASYLEQLAELRDALPDAGMRSGFIVGFPGETDAQFQTLVDFVEKADLDSVGVFTYSHEHNTHAETLDDDVPAETKEARKTHLEEVAEAVAFERQRRRIGTTLEVLCEGEAEDGSGLHGRWRGQAPDVDGRVLIEAEVSAGPIPAGTLVQVEIVEARPTELIGQLRSGPAA